MKVYGFAVAVAILLQSGHALASTTEPTPPVALSPPDPASSPGTAPPHAAAALDAFAATLNLRPDQKAAFDAWRASGAPDPAAQAADTAQRQQALDSAPHFYAYVQAHMVQDLETARRQGAAIGALYAVLSPQQRAAFDKVMLRAMQTTTAPPSVPPEEDDEDVQPNYSLAGRTAPDWLSQPNGDVLAAFYPPQAQQDQVEGRAAVKCIVTPAGVATSCTVVSESPDGYGFGNATVEIASYFRFHPATVYGVPVQSTVTIPLTWKLVDAGGSGEASPAAGPSRTTP